LEALPGIVTASPETRVVVYTAATDAEARRSAIELGAHACVIKGGALMADLPELAARLCGP
jgi:DNA-binding NarL/FixJ family response regulator